MISRQYSSWKRLHWDQILKQNLLKYEVHYTIQNQKKIDIQHILSYIIPYITPQYKNTNQGSHQWWYF